MRIAEIKVLYETKIKASLRPVVQNSADVVKHLRKDWQLMEYIESAKLVLLDRRLRVLGVYDMSKGARSGVIMDPKIIFGIALKGAASGIIIAHNHPSGSLLPSQSDIDLTEKCRKGGEFLELKLADHLILTAEGYYSFSDEGYIPH